MQTGFNKQGIHVFKKSEKNRLTYKKNAKKEQTENKKNKQKHAKKTKNSDGIAEMRSLAMRSLTAVSAMRDR